MQQWVALLGAVPAAPYRSPFSGVEGGVLTRSHRPSFKRMPQWQPDVEVVIVSAAVGGAAAVAIKPVATIRTAAFGSLPIIAAHTCCRFTDWGRCKDGVYT